MIMAHGPQSQLWLVPSLWPELQSETKSLALLGSSVPSTMGPPEAIHQCSPSYGKREGGGSGNVGKWRGRQIALVKLSFTKNKALFNCNRSNILPIERLFFNSPLHIMSPYRCLESQPSPEAHSARSSWEDRLLLLRSLWAHFLDFLEKAVILREVLWGEKGIS